MTESLSKMTIYQPSKELQRPLLAVVPALFADAGDHAANRFIEFFTANIRNPNTRQAYARAVQRFAWWCQLHRLPLAEITPVLVAVYIEEMLLEATVSHSTKQTHIVFTTEF